MSTKQNPNQNPPSSLPSSPLAPVDNRLGALEVFVRDNATGAAACHAEILLFDEPVDCAGFVAANWADRVHASWRAESTDHAGYARFCDLPPRAYVVQYNHVGGVPAQCVQVYPGCTARVYFDAMLGLCTTVMARSADCTLIDCPVPSVPSYVIVNATVANQKVREDAASVKIVPSGGWEDVPGMPQHYGRMVNTPGRQDLMLTAAVPALLKNTAPAAGLTDPDGPYATLNITRQFLTSESPVTTIAGAVTASLARTDAKFSPELPLYALIRQSTDALSFNQYADFLESLFCRNGFAPSTTLKDRFNTILPRRMLPFTDSDSYRVLKAATEAFVMVNCGVLEDGLNQIEQDAIDYFGRRDLPYTTGKLSIQEALKAYLQDVDGDPLMKTLPYLAVIRKKIPDVLIDFNKNEHDANLCYGILQSKLTCPCLLELIWSYWHEEGMLVQTMNVITQRFQNLRPAYGGIDVLANTEIDALRPLNNLLWGYTQDEQHRLTVMRRNYEYNHHYGVSLEGRAVQHFRPADSRSKFLAAFHHLLRLCTAFFKQDDDTTVKADAFPVLNALKEVHLILTEGAHNQFGDLPSTARVEMLIQQWMLSRPEFREFLPTRLMVAYPEKWMDRVDAMKKLQGWTDTSVMHFHSLATFGEQLLLSIRYGHWSALFESSAAFNWARYWRPQIQGYIHAYRAATGVDLSIDASDTRTEAMLPSLLLKQRLAQQTRTQ
jgi:hypothetical protein